MNDRSNSNTTQPLPSRVIGPIELELAIQPYLVWLRAQKDGKKLPLKFRWAAGKHYKANMDKVYYYEDVNTVHGKAITFENEIFFPRKIDFNFHDDVEWLLHELEHVEQYRESGGISIFLLKYFGDSIYTMIKNKTFKFSSDMVLEKQADAKAKSITSTVMNDLIKKSESKPLIETGQPCLANGNCQFLLDNKNNLFVVQKNITGSGMVELHVWTAASGYREHIDYVTGQPPAYDNCEFQLDKHKNLFMIQKFGTGDNMVQVHVWRAASNYKDHIDYSTGQSQVYNNCQFLIDDNNNLFMVQKNITGSGMVELHIWTAASKYREHIDYITGQPPAYDNCEFQLDKHKNLFMIQKFGTGDNMVQVHVWSASKNYKEPIVHASTSLPQANDSHQFLLDKNRDLFKIQKNNTSNGKVVELEIVEILDTEILKLKPRSQMQYFADYQPEPKIHKNNKPKNGNTILKNSSLYTLNIEEKLRISIYAIVPDKRWKIKGNTIWLELNNEEEANIIVNHFKKNGYKTIEYGHKKESPDTLVVLLRNVDSVQLNNVPRINNIIHDDYQNLCLKVLNKNQQSAV